MLTREIVGEKVGEGFGVLESRVARMDVRLRGIG